MKPVRRERDTAAAQAWAVIAFLACGMFAFVAALLDATMEGNDDFGDPGPRGLIVFALASLVATGLATVRASSVRRPLLAPLTVIPAVLLMNEHKGHPGGAAWLLVAGACLFVLFGGFAASGLWRRASSGGAR